jgi:Zn-dependent peptidase ImmA (M78 family)/DNA-binding XRE family transcriptional regulator
MINILENTDPTIFGERLRIARTKAGLTQQEAADKLKMARTTLLSLEKGQRRIREDELRLCAKIYGFSLNAFLRPGTVAASLVPRFRAIPGTDSVKTEEAALLLNDLAAAQVELEAMLGIPFRPNYPAERHIGPGEIKEQAEDAAIEVRQRLGVGMGPIADLVSLLELEFGIRVFIRPLSAGSISGLFAFDETVGACILLNRNHPRERRTLTAAHEFAHFLTSRYTADVFRFGGMPQSREERFAIAFSFALLMPAALVRRRFADLQRETGKFSPRHLILLAHQFGVSEEALCRRLEELGLIPGGTWESLRDRGFSGALVRGVLGDKADDIDTAVPPRLWFLAAEAYRRGLLTEGQVSRMLRADRLEVRTILDTLGVEEWDEFESLAAE